MLLTFAGNFLIQDLLKTNPNQAPWLSAVGKDRKNKSAKFAVRYYKFNERRPDPVSKRTIQYKLHKHNYRRNVVKKKLVIKHVNRKERLPWRRGKRIWTVDNWKRVISSSETNIIIGHDERVMIWRKETKGRHLTLFRKRLNKIILRSWYGDTSVGRAWELWRQSKGI